MFCRIPATLWYEHNHVVHYSLQWPHNGRDGVSNHQPHDCFLNRLFRHRSKKTSKLRVTGLCAGNSPEAGEFPAQMASNAENVSIWWRHHGVLHPGSPVDYPHKGTVSTRNSGTLLWKSHVTSLKSKANTHIYHIYVCLCMCIHMVTEHIISCWKTSCDRDEAIIFLTQSHAVVLVICTPYRSEYIFISLYGRQCHVSLSISQKTESFYDSNFIT